MPRQNRPDGPAIVADAMQSDPIVSEQQTLLGTGESTVKLGNLIVVPVDESLLYVRPFYVESNQVRIPELKKVVAFFESNVAIADTLEQALSQLLGEVPDLDEVVDDDGEIVEVPDDPTAPIDPNERTGTSTSAPPVCSRRPRPCSNGPTPPCRTVTWATTSR